MSQLTTIQLFINADLVQATVPPALSVLDYLRDQQQLTGTKEGCREGDCGACNVLVGRLVNGRLSYHPMTSCLIPMGDLAGKHLVTIEGLSYQRLTVVQAALHDYGASQCGYCTPGFVISLTAWILNPSISLDADGVEDAISGNLCRCTGYKPIKQAARHIAAQLQPFDLEIDRVQLLCKHFGLPAYFLGIEKSLKQLETTELSSITATNINTIVAGATDLYLQENEDLDDSQLKFLGCHTGDGLIKLINDEIIIDSCVTIEGFFNHPVIKQTLPSIHKYRKQIASWPIRCRATLGGNLCNASPVADLVCLMLALEASIDITDSKGCRSMPLKTLYLGYKQLQKLPDEIITTIRIPNVTANTRINWIKVSKRFSLDIATVCSAIKIEFKDQLIVHSNLVFGGVSVIPLCLEKTSCFLKGQEISLQTVLAAATIAQAEISPINDVRGSAKYRRLLVRQLIIAHFIQQFPEYLDEKCLYETLR